MQLKNILSLFLKELIFQNGRLLCINCIILFPVLLNVGPSCSCGKKDPKPTYYLDQEFKDYNSFAKNSYWVYEDSVSGAIDSINLMEKTIKTIITKHNSYNYELLEQTLSSSYLNDTLLGFGEILQSDQPDVYQEFYSNNYGVVSIIYAGVNNVGDICSYNEDIKTRYNSYKDSMIINGQTYYKVKEFEVLQEMDPKLPRKAYYSRNVGIIRRELWNGEVWNLKNYHLN